MADAIICARKRWNIRTANEYLELHARLCAKIRAARGTKTPTPHPIEEVRASYVNHGRHLVKCPCGDHAYVLLEERMGCCAGCGAIMTQIVTPTPRDIETIERALLARPKMMRHWKPWKPVDQLVSDNKKLGGLLDRVRP